MLCNTFDMICIKHYLDLSLPKMQKNLGKKCTSYTGPKLYLATIYDYFFVLVLQLLFWNNNIFT